MVPFKDEKRFEVYINDDAMDQVVVDVAKKKLAETMQKEITDIQRFASVVSLAPKKVIHSFLNRDPASRLGSNGDTSEIKGYPFFRGITWQLLRCMLHVQLTLMLEQEVVQPDVRSELTKLRRVLFYKVLEDLHAHLYNKGEYSSTLFSISERLLNSDNHFGLFGAGDGSQRTSSIDGSSLVEGHGEDGEATLSDGNPASLRINGIDGASKDINIFSHQVPTWLLDSTPDEFVVERCQIKLVWGCGIID
ncbi:hypothetical protein CQW23_14046 [Capsicum baccatum]|uniref:Exocyst complex component Sec8 n=1 Tax=Capsicum baccatum TaxID=33114 RepID=A0A2G2WI15_CAPBA|nr:hypothetical protein CQW23_14046 [Capsicum baccatum]